MLLKQLEYFVSVVENNSFTQAANEQYISQSAISQQIKALETGLGVELIVREKRSFHLTPAGQYLYRTGKKLLERFHDITVETTRIGTDARVSLRIGYLNRYSGVILQQTVIRMAKSHKNLDIRMYSGSHEELYGMLQDRRVDVVFNDQWQVLADIYDTHLVGTARSVIEVPQGYTTTESIDIKQIDDAPLILVCRGKYTLGEEEHYRKAIGYNGAFAYARTLEEARYLVAGNQGLLLLDCFEYLTEPMQGIERKQVTNHGHAIEKQYFFVSQLNQTNTYINIFSDMFKQILDELSVEKSR
ncbi:LysR family transcriptional regulator [Veillonella rodentium]|uniref:Ben and cat operon transcriptional regulator n=1 Tax=Veillonella rodentium TaxID=248315 RepID=A0A239YF67_9FIRM|nr:LysR family transcriptional regulator [Veillonella rodentium]SNV56878.1 Ben and cat operon transcriptional regulator [Veillonella rodentium]